MLGNIEFSILVPYYFLYLFDFAHKIDMDMFQWIVKLYTSGLRPALHHYSFFTMSSVVSGNLSDISYIFCNLY